MSVGLEHGQRGIFWDGHTSYPWTVLGIHCAGGVVILLWSVSWSTLLFGTLKYFEMLRVSTEMEFKGMDLVKHGEAAYPAGAWVEYQYNNSSNDRKQSAINPVMSGSNIGAELAIDGSRKKSQQAAYNDPFEMVPTTGKLMNQMSRTFMFATTAQNGNGNDSNKGVDNPALKEEDENTPTRRSSGTAN